MTTRIDFYLTKEAHFSAQIDFCCRLIEKAYPHHDRIFIQTQDGVQNEAIDHALWNYKPESFLPHIVGQAHHDAKVPAIIIDSNDLSTKLMLPGSLLVLMSKELPNNYNDFQRLCLVTPNIENEVQDARNLYKQLKRNGNEVHIHDLRNK